MMATTHGYAGLAIAAAVAVQWPEFAVAAAVGGILGGLLPDLDVVATHRRTFHFPAYYSLLSVPAVIGAVLWPSAMTTGMAVGMVAASVHALSDVLGGSADARPWATTIDRAVYLHPSDRWLTAREWIRYDGAPEDFFLGTALAVPGLFVFQGQPIIAALALAGLFASAVYTAFRKPIGRRLERVEPPRPRGRN